MCIYTPTNAQGRLPGLIYIHGGGMLGIDAHNIGIYGGSAGGGLAIAVARRVLA